MRVDMDTTLGDILALPGGAQIIGPIMKDFEALAGDDTAKDPDTAAIFEAMARYMPLHGIRSFAGGQVTEEMLQGIIAMLNR